MRDAIVAFLSTHAESASVEEIRLAVERQIGSVSPSSVRSYLNLNPEKFERTGRGEYRLRR